MSNWYPGAGNYIEHLQNNSYIRDIKGQIVRTGNVLCDTISSQTYEIVANNKQLERAFGAGFNAIDGTLEWGFGRLESALQDIHTSFESLHSDFVYGVGLLVAQAQIQNKHLSDLLEKLDAIHRTLQSPTLTKAREYYRLGCERFQKGLLDKALEAFIEAEKNNDTDFFTQFNIGLLYLYGRDDDDNVVDLEKAKKHLSLAARYAKAEITVDPSFAKLAAEALLKTSLSVYFQLGDKQLISDTNTTSRYLMESKNLAEEAIKFNPQLSEAYYHVATYSALLNDVANAISHLEKAIMIDRNYTVKVDTDRAFDKVRSQVNDLLKRLKLEKKYECQEKVNNASQLLRDLSEWAPAEVSKKNHVSFRNSEKEFAKAEEHFQSGTYFGFLDAIPLLEKIITEIIEMKTTLVAELSENVNNSIKEINKILPIVGKHSIDVENGINEIQSLIQQGMTYLNTITVNSFTKAIATVAKARDKANKIRKLADTEDENRRCKEQEERERQRKLENGEYQREELQKRRDKASNEYFMSGARYGGIVGFFSGCLVAATGARQTEILGVAFGGAVVGAMLCALIGALIGYMIGQSKD